MARKHVLKATEMSCVRAQEPRVFKYKEPSQIMEEVPQIVVQIFLHWYHSNLLKLFMSYVSSELLCSKTQG
jgi:hypothetical protein